MKENPGEAPSPKIAYAAWIVGTIALVAGTLFLFGSAVSNDANKGGELAVGLGGMVFGFGLVVIGSITDKLSRIEQHLRPGGGHEASV